MSEEKDYKLEDIIAEFSEDTGSYTLKSVPKEEKRPAGAELFEWLQMVLVCVLGAVIAFNLVVRLSVVDGQSMDPTLEHGELMLVWSLGYSPKQGDIVIVNKTIARGFLHEQAIVKRVIALGGQTVDIDYGEGVVYVDGEALDEPYILEPTRRRIDFEDETVVPDGCLFVLGDNTAEAIDSRASSVGLIRSDEVLGTVW